MSVIPWGHHRPSGCKVSVTDELWNRPERRGLVGEWAALRVRGSRLGPAPVWTGVAPDPCPLVNTREGSAANGVALKNFLKRR